MADSETTASVTADDAYQVVALRYRPQAFGELVGQGHIATALSNAIEQSRVGHAYLFTGARGVGKTSSARIFAKCLNCTTGPTTTPCNECDVCQAVSTGEDVDVLEIDGASNRGIDEIRQLRSNAAIRPSRGRFKIYIIDEVHMLTQQAFNALLKTLEEPPSHVKFIFCTTDPQKIPITVLSRCQRFDFSPVQPDKIADRLREIAINEGVTPDDQALALLARRANGSMRDSQSLLEQLFSFCDKTISVEEVHQLLGTSDIARIAEIAAAAAAKDSGATLRLIHQTVSEGSDAGQIAEQLLGYFRDAMAVRVGCDENTLLSCSPSDMDGLKHLADQLGLETILSCVQVLDEALVRMQSSLHARTLLEVATIRICNLEHLDAIGDLIESLSSAGGGATVAKTSRAPQKKPVKKNEAVTPEATVTPPAASVNHSPIAASPIANAVSHQSTANPTNAGSTTTNSTAQTAPAKSPPAAVAPISEANPSTTSVTSTKPAPLEPTAPATPKGPAASDDIETAWKNALAAMSDVTSDMVSQYEGLTMPSPDQLTVTMGNPYHSEQCAKPERKQKIEAALATAAGRPIRVDFVVSKAARERQLTPVPKMSRNQQIRKLRENAFVKQTIDMFDAEVMNFYETKR